MNEPVVERAAEVLRAARTLIITAGAGMGVDSGLPDFRGTQGFWRAYPMYEKLGINFVDAANPGHFTQDPAFAWGFYGHRTSLYRETEPHRGFSLLLEWIQRLSLRAFVVTSNVDGQFQKAGFSEQSVFEVHGSIHHLQCSIPCTRTIWANPDAIKVDPDTMQATCYPRCLRCGAVARPNILMFGDSSWLSGRTDGQCRRFQEFMSGTAGPMVVIEVGAGTALPTIRNLGERLGAANRAVVIRINPREWHISRPHLSLHCGALEGLQRIETLLKG